MRRVHGFTLIELMITAAVIAILAAVAFPSYQDYIRRAVRSQGQQYLSDLAQRQEQYFLDFRNYGTAVQLNVPVPPEVAAKYQTPATFTIVLAAPTVPPTFRINLAPIAGGTMANDGTLIINNLQQRWRSTDPADAAYTAGNDCLWEDARCKPT